MDTSQSFYNNGNNNNRRRGGNVARGRGRGRGNSSEPQWDRAAAQPFQREFSDERPRARALPPQKTRREEAPDLTPKYKSTTPSVDRNDPMMTDAVLLEGIAGLQAATHPRTFKNDYSQFSEIVRASYVAQIGVDRGLKKYISFGMYQYYCTILFWIRLYTVQQKRGKHVHDIERLRLMIPDDMPVPLDVKTYLDGIGNITDANDREFDLEIHELHPMNISGVQGSFGQVNQHSHIEYETAPAPIVAVWKLIADLNRTCLQPADGPVEWDLPTGVRPASAEITLPTMNLLGWSKADRLSDDQRETLLGAGFNTWTQADQLPQSVTNVGGVPLNQQLIQFVAGIISSSKVKAYSLAENVSNKGSISQTLYTTRASDDVEPDPFRPVSCRTGITNSYSQQNGHIACGAAIARYRLKRDTSGETDTFGYRNAPTTWNANINSVFTFGAAQTLWNISMFRISQMSGAKIATDFATRVRSKLTRD